MADVDLEREIETLCHLRDKEYAISNQEKARRLQKAVDELLPRIPDPATAPTAEQRARLHYYHGKVLDCLPSYHKDAEVSLSKALKNDPTLVDAWLTLGHCFWKKENLAEALNSFRSAENLAPKDKKAIREVARVLRLTGADQESRRQNVRGATEKARQAVALDVSDGTSWYILGNCLLSHFMVVTGDPADLMRAVKAYTQAEGKGEGQNPDLHFNKGTVFRYNTDYEAAYASFGKALALDPALQEALQEMVTLRLTLNLTTEKLALKQSLPTRTLDKHLHALHPFGTAVAIDNVPHITTPIADLLAAAGTPPKGLENRCLVLYVLHLISRSNESPLTYVACDKNKTTLAVTVYNVNTLAVKEGEELIVPEPNVRHYQFTLPGVAGGAQVAAASPDPSAPSGAKPVTLSDVMKQAASYNFHHLTVADAKRVLIGRKKIPGDRFLSPQLTVTAFT